MSDDARTLFQRLEARSDLVRERNDCTVKAVAAAADVPYDEARRLLAENGRKNGRAVHTRVYHAALQALGFKVYEVERPRCTRRTLLDHLRPVGTYLVRTRGHVFCVRDGVQIDYASSARSLKRVRDVFAVCREGEDPTEALVYATNARRPAASRARGKNLGVGEFMRGRILAGDEPKKVAEAARARFPGSTATVKDVYMVRRKMKETRA